MKTLFDVPYKLIGKFFKETYSLEISEDFLECADVQLSRYLEVKGFKSKNLISLLWLPEEKLELVYGKVSNLSVTIRFKYGLVKTQITWVSKSGHIYHIQENKIDCDDIEFSFSDTNFEDWRKLITPHWSLITFPDAFIQLFKHDFGLDISIEFVKCADKQLSQQFENATGITINKDVSLSSFDKNYSFFKYSNETISKLTLRLYVNGYSNQITICWKSETSRSYSLSDRSIDCNSLKFWFEEFDIIQYLDQFYKTETLSLGIKKLSFDLQVFKIDSECRLVLFLNLNSISHSERVITKIDAFINKFNTDSEQKNRRPGVVHNGSGIEIHKGVVEYEIDLGSAGLSFLKKLLAEISKTNYVSKIEIR